MPPQKRLPFEKRIAELEDALARLEAEADGHPAKAEAVRNMRRELVKLLRDTYSRLSPWDTILVARHDDRPQTMDYVELAFDDFCELHGDRAIGDDRALR